MTEIDESASETEHTVDKDRNIQPDVHVITYCKCNKSISISFQKFSKGAKRLKMHLVMKELNICSVHKMCIDLWDGLCTVCQAEIFISLQTNNTAKAVKILCTIY